MVDKNIGVPALSTNNVYLYKNKVVIPPLTMQDDTLGVTECGFKSRKMNNFLNTRTQIMGLQFGSKKCEKMHIGKKLLNSDICVDFEVDIWENQLSNQKNGKSDLVDVHMGKEKMKNVTSKKYLGQIIQSNGKSDLKVKEHTDKAFGNVSKIKNALNERPYGKHSYKAALLMREAMLLGGLLPNVETWINVTEADITKLTTPDTMLHRSILSSSGNPSKVFMCLELGIIPVKYVIMKKRITFLNYILNESTTSIIRQVYDALKQDSRKGDFFQLVQKDLKHCNLQMTEEEIKNYTKTKWKNVVSDKVKRTAFDDLVAENLKLENTKNIVFKEMKLSNYLNDNRNSTLSKIIFSVRSNTIDLKMVQPWKYYDNLCVLCEVQAETITHFMSCSSYENIPTEETWKLIIEGDPDDQFKIAENIRKRQKLRNKKIDEYEAGHPQEWSDSRTPGDC
jgi:hypothetical protein